MSYLSNKDFLIEVAKGNVAGHSLVQKFGRNESVGATFEPLSIGGVYQTLQVGSATTLRVKAGNAGDTAAGAGAREVTLQGLDQTGAEVTSVLATTGAVASAVTAETFIRGFRVWVSKSGTYATSLAGSHVADVVIENGAGGTDWGTISSTGFPRSQSEIAAYSVPLGKTAYLLDYTLTSDGNKDYDFLFFKREGILDTVAPYQAMRIQSEGVGIQGEFSRVYKDPMKFTELTDIGLMVKAATGTPDISGEFNLLVVDN